MKYILIILVTAKLMACSNGGQTIEETSVSKSSDSGKVIPPSIEDKPGTDITGCYMKIIGRDTAILMLEQKGNMFTGKMLYDN